MKINEVAKIWLEYHKAHSKENSIRTYRIVLTHLCDEFGGERMEDITTERVLSLLNRITEGKKTANKTNTIFTCPIFF